MLRKRDGGEGQQHQIVPLDFTFNATAIQGYMSHGLPELVLTENTHILLALGFIEKIDHRKFDPNKKTKPELDGYSYMIKYPESAPA